ncbi:hypothetical protein [Legionella antarctica]|uniref:hypothetical protein n=1 Tax=Legionella antarctica TaxID=2708020 RepID=UPI001564F689|nr:hypothetical protein [Legionella antarctica]
MSRLRVDFSHGWLKSITSLATLSHVVPFISVFFISLLASIYFAKWIAQKNGFSKT